MSICYNAFYENLEEHFDCFEPGKYSYSAIWGNGMEAPKGESDQEDISFSIDIERGSKTFHIRVGEWQHFDYAGKKEDTDNSVVIAYGE